MEPIHIDFSLLVWSLDASSTTLEPILVEVCLQLFRTAMCAHRKREQIQCILGALDRFKFDAKITTRGLMALCVMYVISSKEGESLVEPGMLMPKNMFVKVCKSKKELCFMFCRLPNIVVPYWIFLIMNLSSVLEFAEWKYVNMFFIILTWHRY